MTFFYQMKYQLLKNSKRKKVKCCKEKKEKTVKGKRKTKTKYILKLLYV